MKENFDSCFNMVLKHEGGFVEHPKDPGGMTNLGVTKAVWEAYLGREAAEAEMRALTPDSVKPVYKTKYWDKIKGDALPAGVDYATFDFAVNSGPNKAAKTLQKIAGVLADGVIGIKSLDAIQACAADDTIDALCDMRMEFLKSLSTFEIFGKGWTDRVMQVRTMALRMAQQNQMRA